MPTDYLVRKRTPQTDIRFEDCTFLSRGTTLSYNPCPVYNVTLKNCVIRDVRGENERKRSRVSPVRISLARMEERAAKESPEDFEVAAFCQAFAPLLVDDRDAADLDERIAEVLREYEVGYPMGVIEYSDEARLAPVVDVLYGKLKQ